jgi:predicted DNA-binding transcriptional regulator AlpA
VDLIGLAGLAELLGVARSRADQLARQKGFPEPAAIIDGRTRVWERAVVEQWARETGRMQP